MPRSNNPLSGCLESTLANGLSTFLLVHAVVSASVPARTITGIRKEKDMKTSVMPLCNSVPSVVYAFCNHKGHRVTQRKNLHFLQRGFKRRLQQCLGINLWIAVATHRVARHQNFCPSPYYLAYCLYGDPAIHLNPVIPVLLFTQVPDLL